MRGSQGLAGLRVTRNIAAAAGLVTIVLTAAAGAGPDNTTSESNVWAKNAGGPRLYTADQCLLCHDFDASLSHPINVPLASGMTASPELPLEQGRVTCLTCHTGIDADHSSGRSANTTDLGLLAGSLCLSCHDSAGSSAADLHAVGLRRAHLPGAEGGWAVRSGGRTSLGDNALTSGTCLTCHDGAMATDASVGFESMIVGLPSPNAVAHPVSVEYRMSDPFNEDGRLRPASSLDSRVRLVNHRVECTSCHSPYSREPGHLVMSNEGSRLCLECHEL